MAEPFIWGKTDCMMVLADYVLDVTGKDPAAHLRDAYFSRMDCARLTGFHKDPVGVFRSCVDTIGLDETNDPQEGDIGVINVLSNDGPVIIGALCLGKNWGAKGENQSAIIGKPIQVLAAWKIP